MGPPAPRTIGRFEVQRELGRGGMGVVYLANDALLGRQVAVKMLPPSVFDSAAARERFLAEARLAASLDEPHVIPIYDVGEDDGALYLAMRFVEGNDLLALLIRDGRLETPRVLRLARQLARALDAAHAQGLIHSDVKPSNGLVAVQSDGREHVYLSDFGLARKIDAAESVESQLVGTLGYMAPEQIRGGIVDGSADVYALGCVLYQCLTGSPPYVGSEAEVLWGHLESLPPKPSEMNSATPAAVDLVLARAMAKDPAERYATCQQLADELEVAALSALAQNDRAFATALPRSAQRLIGRSRELHDLSELLGDPEVRLVTVLGAGGVGKTRLAMELARRLGEQYPAGIWFIELGGLTDPALVTAAIASSVGLIDTTDDLGSRLAAHLAERDGLLVLDNFEQLLAAARDVAGIISPAGGTTILVTSRGPLQLAHEHQYPLEPFPTPVSATPGRLGELLESDAVALFCERAEAARPGFRLTAANAPSVVQICAQVDGLPLALELAAARVKLLAPGQLSERLAASLAVLAQPQRDAPERQRSLQATIDWSYHLLGSPEQRLFAELSVFAGDFTLQAAEAVTTAGEATLERLERLTEASLVSIAGSADKPRCRLLQMVRRYAQERLAQLPEERLVRDRHLEFFERRVRGLAVALRSDGHADALRGLKESQDDVRAALAYAMHGDRPEDATRLAVALGDYWDITGAWSEGLSAIDMLLETPQGVLSNASRSILLAWRAHAAVRQGDLEQAARIAAASVDGLRQAGDQDRLAFALEVSGSVAYELDDPLTAARFQREALEAATAAGDMERRSFVLCDLANSLWDTGCHDEAEALSEEALRLYARRGDRFGATLILLNQSAALLSQDQYEAGRGRLEACQESYADVLDASPTLATQFLLNHGLAEFGCGRTSAAVCDLIEALRRSHDVGKVPFAIESAEALVLALRDTDPEVAAWLDGLATSERAAHHLLAAEPLVTRSRAETQKRLSTLLGSERLDQLREEGARSSIGDAVARLEMERR